MNDQKPKRGRKPLPETEQRQRIVLYMLPDKLTALRTYQRKQGLVNEARAVERLLE